MLFRTAEKRKPLTFKLKILLAVIVLEVALLAFWFYRQSGGNASAPTESENFFVLSDTSGIDRIILGKNVMQRIGGEWQLNNRYQADKALLHELLTLLQKIEIRQIVDGTEGEQLRSDIEKQGQHVEVWRGKERILAFKIWGNQGNTYAVSAAQRLPAALYIPGYGVDVYEALTLPEGEWRNKTLVSAGWLGIRRIRIRYSETPDQNIDIRRTDEFYDVEGVSRLDSAMLYRYIEAYRNFRVYTFVDNPTLRDSLLRLIPFCEMEIQTLSQKSGLNVYASKQAMYGITQPGNELVQLEPRYFTRFLMRRKDFER